jgi:hemerythrin-like domain-containing protein
MMMTPCCVRLLVTLLVLFIVYAPPIIHAAPRQSTALYTHSQTVRDPTGDDNNSGYNWPPEQDAMILAHNAIRKEVQDMKCALERTIISIVGSNSEQLEAWKIDAIRTWWKGHEAHVRFHCQNESGHLHPLMSERLQEFPVERLRQEHDSIYQYLENLSALVSKLKTEDDIQELLEQWCRYMEMVFSHFQREEEEGVVSTRQAFTAKEWAPIIKGFFDLGAKEEFGSFIHSMGEEEFRTTFMRQRKIPGFVWRLAFQKNLRYYETSMVQYMNALLGGVPPNQS